MSTTDLLYSEVEEDLRSTVRRVFQEHCPPEVVNTAYESGQPTFANLWRRLAVDVGVAGLLIPEEHGGVCATTREAAVVMEEIGRAVAPVPFLSSAVTATVACVAVRADEVVSKLGNGELTAALVVPLSLGIGQPVPAAARDERGLNGHFKNVAGVLEADLLVVPVAGPEGMELHSVEQKTDGLDVSRALSLDMTRPLADVRFSGVASTRIDNGTAEVAVQTALSTATVLLASEQVGIAQWCFETTLAYVKQRRQFGRPIGSYQAIKHRIADLSLRVSSATAAARYAADTWARGDADAPVAAAVAASYCGDVAVLAAEECIQLHGGLGITWEYPAHLYLKRGKSDQIALGTSYQHRARLAGLVNLPATA